MSDLRRLSENRTIRDDAETNAEGGELDQRLLQSRPAHGRGWEPGTPVITDDREVRAGVLPEPTDDPGIHLISRSIAALVKGSKSGLDLSHRDPSQVACEVAMKEGSIP